MHKALISLLCTTCYLCLPAHADDNHAFEDLKAGRIPLTMLSPIYSELVSFQMPGNFKIVTEQVRGPFYIREAVLRNETADRWTQMITITGIKGIANNPNINPQKMAEDIVIKFQRACQPTFSGKNVGALTIGGHDAFEALASCGTAQNGGYTHSETALLLFIKGTEDYYTLQWAERGTATDTPLDLNDVKWQERFNTLSPIMFIRR